jgi:ferredoxin
LHQRLRAGRLLPEKQLVRGVERWYVDFDKCIPFFAEAASCGICIAECPWTNPAVRPKLLSTMSNRRASKEATKLSQTAQ